VLRREKKKRKGKEKEKNKIKKEETPEMKKRYVRGAEFVAFGAESFSGLVQQLSGEGARADTGGVSLHHTDHGIELGGRTKGRREERGEGGRRSKRGNTI
jgi:hypothetical protein